MPGPPEEFMPDPYYYGEEYWGWEGDPFAGPPMPVSQSSALPRPAGDLPGSLSAV